MHFAIPKLITKMNKQIKNKYIEHENMVNTLDLMDIYKTLHLTMAEYTFLSAHGIFTKIDHILGHKASFKGLKSCRVNCLTIVELS